MLVFLMLIYSFAQVVIEERRKVFEKLLKAYESTLRTLAEAQLAINHQAAEIHRLKGDCFTFSGLCPITSFSHTDISGFLSLCAHGGRTARLHCRADC